MDRIVRMGEMLVEMECPVCTEYMHPPIRQCLSGHSFCYDCQPRLKKCPTCRTSLYNTVRCIVLERLHSKMFFPCRFREAGCTGVEAGPNIQYHEYHCKYGGTACPLKDINKCEWMGRPRDYIAHCNEDHPNNMFCCSSQRLTCTDFLRETGDDASSVSYYIMFYCYDEFFKCAWEINYESGVMRWCVFRIEQNNAYESSDDYEFVVEFPHATDQNRRVSINAPCPVTNLSDGHSFNDVVYMPVHYDMVKDFCKGNDLSYCVKISKRYAHFYN